MTILHFKVILAAIFIKININNRKTRPYGQFYSLVTSKYVPLRTTFTSYVVLYVCMAFVRVLVNTFFVELNNIAPLFLQFRNDSSRICYYGSLNTPLVQTQCTYGYIEVLCSSIFPSTLLSARQE